MCSLTGLRNPGGLAFAATESGESRLLLIRESGLINHLFVALLLGSDTKP
jgi:hypothetical protein